MNNFSINLSDYFDLIEAQDEYIKFLGEHVDFSAVILSLHGMHTNQADIDKGQELRYKIKKCKKIINGE